MASPTLPQTLATTKALTSHLLTTLQSPPSASPHAIPDAIPDATRSPNPLSLSATSAKLLKALTTKLTLLSLNTPFSPTAISDILSQASTSPLPALVTSVQLCEPTSYGQFLSTELKRRTIALLSAFEKLLHEVPVTKEAQDAKLLAAKVSGIGLEREDAGGLGGGGKKDALVGTGLVWGACDELSALCEVGIDEMAARKMETWRDLTHDAVQELEEWVQEAEEGHDDSTADSESNNDDEKSEFTQDAEETLSRALRSSHLSSSSSSSSISFTSKPSPQTLSTAQFVLPILTHITLIFPPLIKRRLRRFPVFTSKTPLASIPAPDLLARLDSILDLGRIVSETTDAVAEALYECDTEEARSRLKQTALEGSRGLLAAMQSWDGGTDVLGEWGGKWVAKARKLGALEQDELHDTKTADVGSGE